jgi:hypothetical protein
MSPIRAADPYGPDQYVRDAIPQGRFNDKGDVEGVHEVGGADPRPVRVVGPVERPDLQWQDIHLPVAF